jgi:hypothetical protein
MISGDFLTLQFLLFCKKGTIMEGLQEKKSVDDGNDQKSAMD